MKILSGDVFECGGFRYLGIFFNFGYGGVKGVFYFDISLVGEYDVNF